MHVERAAETMPRPAYAKATGLNRSSGDLTKLARALTRQAQIARDQKSLIQTEAFRAEALELTRRYGGRLAHVIRHLAEILSEVGRAGEAERLYVEMLGLYRADPSTPPLEMANAIRSVARHAETQAEHELALTLWTEARDRYAALDAVFLELIGSADNPGVKEAD